MAFDPNQLATEQSQRTAMDAAGAPTEFAGAPERLTQVAGGGPFKQLLEALGRSVIKEVPPAALPASPLTDPRFVPAPGEVAAGVDPAAVAIEAAPPASVIPVQRIPTPQERRLLADNGQYSERAAKQALAPDVLSPEGVQRFQERGLEAPGVNAPLAQPVEDVTQLGLNALDQQAADAAAGAEGIRTDAGKALNAEAQGFRAEAGVAPEAIADPVLDAMARRDLEIKSLKEGGDFNFDYLNTTDDVKAAITAVGETLSSEQAAITRGVVSNKTTIEEAAKLAEDELGFTRKLLATKAGTASLNAAEMVAARDLLVRSATRLATLAQSIKTGGGAIDRLAFRRQLAIHAGIQLQLKGAQTEAARALQSFRIPVSGDLSAARMGEEALRALQEFGDDAATDELAKRILETGRMSEGQRLKELNALAQKGWGAKTVDMATEAYLAGLLSAPSSQAKNIVSTAGHMIFQLPEEILAGAIGSVFRKVKGKNSPYNLREDQAYMADAMIRLKGWVDSVGDAFRISSIAFRTEIPTEAMNKLDYNVGSMRWTGDNTGTFYAKSIDTFGKAARLPFRLLLAGDEFFKTVSQRGELYVAAHRRYQTNLRFGNDEKYALDEAGMVLLDPRSVAEDLNYQSRYDTMTLDAGILGKAASAWQKFPIIGRLTVPFSTAPTNEILRTLERLLPVNVVPSLIGKNGPRAQQLALSRWAMGGMTAAYAMNLTAQGKLTGAWPVEEKERQALPPGWQPYSVVLRGENFPLDEDGDKMPLYDEYGRPNGPLLYVNYSGYGPYSSIVGIAASFTQTLAMARDGANAGTIGSAIIGSVVDYYKQLPMLQGLSDVFDFADNYDITKIARSPASAATPVGFPNVWSSLQRGVTRALDPTRVSPREDVEYYTMAEVEAGFAAGDKFFTSRTNGKPNYYLVGIPKSGMGQYLLDTWKVMTAYQQQDSMFADEKDLNAVKYDTFGKAIGAEDVSFAARPGLAIWNITTGMIVKPGRELTLVESEMMRLAKEMRTWPITNRESLGDIKLSPGVQSDLTRIAKNAVTLNVYGRGPADFRGSLAQLVGTTQYLNATDKEKLNFVRQLNDYFYDGYKGSPGGIASLLQREEYANLAQAYQDVKSLKEQGLK